MTNNILVHFLSLVCFLYFSFNYRLLLLCILFLYVSNPWLFQIYTLYYKINRNWIIYLCKINIGIKIISLHITTVKSGYLKIIRLDIPGKILILNYYINFLRRFLPWIGKKIPVIYTVIIKQISEWDKMHLLPHPPIEIT